MILLTTQSSQLRAPGRVGCICCHTGYSVFSTSCWVSQGDKYSACAPEAAIWICSALSRWLRASVQCPYVLSSTIAYMRTFQYAWSTRASANSQSMDLTQLYSNSIHAISYRLAVQRIYNISTCRDVVEKSTTNRMSVVGLISICRSDNQWNYQSQTTLSLSITWL